MDFMLAALGVAFAAFGIWLVVRIVNRREKSRRMIWITALAAAAMLSYPLSFGPACRLSGDHLIPEAQFMTVYRPCIRIACDGPEAVRGPLCWWVERCGGQLGLIIAMVRDWMGSPSSFEDAEEVARQAFQVLQENAGAKSLDDESVPGETE